MNKATRYYTHKDDTAKRWESRAGTKVFLIEREKNHYGQWRTRQFVCDAASVKVARLIAKALNG